MELKDIALLIAGALLGVVGSFVLFILQFRASIAFRRVERVAQATNEILGNEGRSGPLRDTHRYSLGVVIDKLRDLKRSGPPWPCLIELKSNDRWDIYNKYIRSVVEEIAPYAFLGRWLPLSAWPGTLPQVYALSQLRDQLEMLVGLLDGAYEEKAITIDCETESVTAVHIESYRHKLEIEYRRLYDCWEVWKRTTPTH